MQLDSCGFCDYKDKKKWNVTRHIKAVHYKIKDHKCSFCDYAAAGETTLNEHIKEVHWKTRDRECKQCDFKCSSRRALLRHVKIVHNKIKDYECTACGHKFGSNFNLIRHSKVHEKDKKVPDNTQNQAEPSSSPVAGGPSRRLGAHEANAAACHDSNGNGNVLVGLTLLTREDVTQILKDQLINDIRAA